MRRPILPLGSAAPWVLGTVGVVLLALGWAAGSRETLAAGAIALAVLVVAFPLAAVLLGREEPDDE